MSKNFQKRASKEYNVWRGFFQWLTCRVVYGTYFRLAYNLKIEGRENVPKKGFFILASTHASAIDPFIIIDAVGRHVAFMAKVELFQSKIACFFLDLLGAFAVDRSKLSVSTIKTALGIKQTNWVLGIFPQGTREKNGNLDNLNKGFASFAKTLKCDILPVAVMGVVKDKRKLFRSEMKVKIGKPIPYNDNISELMKVWSEKVKELSSSENEENKKESEKDSKRESKKEVNFAQRKAKDFNILTRLYQYYALYILFLPIFATLFYKFKVKRNKKLDKKPYIVAPNHISYMDVFIVNYAVGRPLAYMAKQELFKTNNWMNSWVTRNVIRLGGFAVNREKVGLSTIKSVKEVVKAKYNLCIFPQGGIRKNMVIENINPGFIYFAKTNKIDILPVALSGLEQYNWKPFRKQKVNIAVGNPISYDLAESEIISQWAKQIADMTGYENKCP